MRYADVSANSDLVTVSMESFTGISLDGVNINPIAQVNHFFSANTAYLATLYTSGGEYASFETFTNTSNVPFTLVFGAYAPGDILARRPAPSGLSVAGSVYSLDAFSSGARKGTFDGNYRLSIVPTEGQMATFDQESIGLYFFDEGIGSWINVSNTRSALLNHTTLFALFGKLNDTRVASQVSGGRGGNASFAFINPQSLNIDRIPDTESASGAGSRSDQGPRDGEADTQEIPKELFDIDAYATKTVFSSSETPEIAISFNNFGTIPSAVELKVTLLNSFGEKIDVITDKIIIETDAVHRVVFNNVLSPGEYSVLIETLYGNNIKDLFNISFKVAPEQIIKQQWNYVAIMIVAFVLIISLVTMRKYLVGKQKLRKLSLFAFIFIFAFLAPNFSYASIPYEINYVAELKDASGFPVANDSYNARFKLYTVAEGGAPIWTETRCFGSSCDGTGTDSRVSITGGIFSVMLGSLQSLVSVDFNQTLYLGVEIGSTSTVPVWDGEMTPRKKVGAVPSAFNADKLDGLDSSAFFSLEAWQATTTDALSEGSANIYYTDSRARNALSSGSAALSYANSTGQFTIAEASETASGIVSTGTQTFAGNKTFANSLYVNSNIGIGTTTPINKLHINSGALEISGAYTQPLGTSLTLSQEADYGMLQSWNFRPMYINPLGNNTILNLGGGNVGIGTTTPSQTLAVSGGASFHLSDNTANVFRITGGAYEYLNINTANNSEALYLWNQNTPANIIIRSILSGSAGVIRPDITPEYVATAFLSSTLDGISYDSGSFAKIAVPPDGKPVIVYRNYTYNEMRVLKCGDSSCSSGNTITSVYSANVANYFSIAFKPGTSIPVISFTEYTNKDLYLLSCGNELCSSGNTTTNVDATGDLADQTAVVVPPDGRPIIAYQDTTNGDLVATRCGNATCSSGNTRSIVNDLTANMGRYASMAFGNDGYPVISYYDVTGADLEFTKCGNLECSSGNITTTLDATTAGQHNSIVVPSDGLPVISYYKGASDLYVYKCSNEMCTAGVATAVDTTNDVGQYSSIVIASDGYPAVSYYDNTAHILKYLKCSRADCLTANTIKSFSEGANWVGLYTSIAIGSDGFPVIVYYDNSGYDLEFIKCPDNYCSATSLGAYNGYGVDIGTGEKFFRKGYFGTLYAKNSVINAFDIAEDYPANDSSLIAGEIVALDNDNSGYVRRADGREGERVIGVVSTQPALRLAEWNSSQKTVPIALVGRVSVFLSAENGVIKTGDGITLSSAAGVGRKAKDNEYIIGYALDNYDGDGMQKVEVMVQNRNGTGGIDAEELMTSFGILSSSSTSTTNNVSDNDARSKFFDWITEKLKEWLASAANGINKLFAKEYCGVADDGETYCLTGEDIKEIQKSKLKNQNEFLDEQTEETATSSPEIINENLPPVEVKMEEDVTELDAESVLERAEE